MPTNTLRAEALRLAIQRDHRLTPDEIEAQRDAIDAYYATQDVIYA